MKKVVKFIFLGVISYLYAQNPSDIINFYRDKFLLILERDKSPYKGIVRYQDDDFNYIVYAEPHPVYTISYRKRLTVSEIYLGSFSTVYDKELLYYSSSAIFGNFYGKKWKVESYWSQCFAGIDKIYKILTNPSPTPGSFSATYIATNKGLYAGGMSLSSPAYLKFLYFSEKNVYDLVFHPDSIGPIPSGTDTIKKEVIFAGTDDGVYKLRVTGRSITHDTIFPQVKKIGITFKDPVYAVYYDGSTHTLYAGREDGLFYKLPTGDWTPVPAINFPVKRIKKAGSYLFTCTSKGLYYLEGGIWKDAGFGETFHFTDVVFYNGEYYASAKGKGVYKFIPGNPSSILEVNKGLDFYEKAGSKNVHVLYVDPSQDILLAGTDLGVFIFNSSETTWENNNYGIGRYTPDWLSKEIFNLINNPFGTGKNIAQIIRESNGIQKDSLWDIDKNGRINIVMYNFYCEELGGDITPNAQYTLDVNVGAFDPYDLNPLNPYSNKGEIFFLNTGKIVDVNVDTIFKERIKKTVAYLYGDFIGWCSDRNEHPSFGRAGFGTMLAYKAGFDLLKGVDKFLQFAKYGVEWGGQGQYTYLGTNTRLFFINTAWRRYPLIADIDRERTFYFTRYLMDHFGDSIFYKMLYDKKRDGDSLFKYYLSNYGLKFEEAFINWAFANVIDTPFGNPYYEYKTISSPLLTYLSEPAWSIAIPFTASEPYRMDVFAFLTHTVVPTEAKPVIINSEDNIGKDLKKLHVFRIKKVDNVVTEIKPLNLENIFVLKKDVNGKKVLLDSVNLNSLRDYLVPEQGVKYYYLVINTYPKSIKYTIVYGDTIPPVVVDIYVLQNLIAERDLEFYFVTKEKVYKDVEITEPPILKIVPFDASLSSLSIPLQWVGSSTSYQYYNASLDLPVTYKGDFFVYVRAQDISGNYVILEDTFSVQKITYGSYAFLNGEIKMEINKEDFVTSYTCVANKIKPEVLGEEGGLIYSIGTSKMMFKNPVPVKIKIDPAYKNYIVFRKNGNNWERLLSFVDKENGEIIFYTDRLGLFKITEGESTPLPNKLEVKLLRNAILRNGNLDFLAALPFKDRLLLKVYDIKGTLIFEKTFFFEAGYHRFSIPVCKFPSGVYIIKIKTNDFDKNYKFIVF